MSFYQANYFCKRYHLAESRHIKRIQWTTKKKRKRSLQEVCAVSCLIVNSMKRAGRGWGTQSFICNVDPRLPRARHLSALIQYSYLFVRQAESCTNSGVEPPSLPSIFTSARQVLGTAGLTLISLKYLFHPSSEQIEQKHWRLFRASANALETSRRQKSSVRIHSLGL